MTRVALLCGQVLSEQAVWRLLIQIARLGCFGRGGLVERRLAQPSVPSIALIFFSLLFWKRQGKSPKKQRFFILAEPLKS